MKTGYVGVEFPEGSEHQERGYLTRKSRRPCRRSFQQSRFADQKQYAVP